ncbi:MAG: cysteine synthase family protein [Candidatus Caldarchaeum sp.]|nr:cysteine synthase family protein [Candidatus Caldarchaeum sp.]
MTFSDTLVKGRGLAEFIGNTPLIRLKMLEKPGVKVYGKCEMFNPGGSVKDRPALNIILDAEKKGLLTPRKTLLDATSGNTGIAYAMLAASMGYSVKMVVPSNISKVKLTKMKAFGAEVVMTNALEGMEGAIKRAREFYEEEPERYFYADQYSNPANPEAHYRSTGPEIWMQTSGMITHLVAGVGTSGTLQGTALFLKQKNPQLRVVEVQPESEFHGIEGLKFMSSAARPQLYREDIADVKMLIETEEAVETMKKLLRSGIPAGVSGGAAAAAALKLVNEVDNGLVVVILPDGVSNVFQREDTLK